MKRLSILMLASLALCLTPASTLANDIAFFQTIYNTDFTVAGVGGMRDIGSGVITLSGVTGKVTRAYLYWNGPMNTASPTANASVIVNNHPVVGVNIGLSSPNCWAAYMPPVGLNIGQAYRADVTSLVASNRNGAYNLTGFAKPMHTPSAPININGASLIVFFDDGNPANNRDVVLFEGNDSNAPNVYDALGWDVTLAGIKYTAGTAAMQLHVSDGQFFVPRADDGPLKLNGQVIAAGPNVFAGNSVPSANNGPAGNGSLWDIKNYDATTFLHPGTNSLNLTFGYVSGDCVSLVVAAISLPAGAAPPPTNHPPTIICPVPMVTESTALAVTLQAQVQDSDGNALAYTITMDNVLASSGIIPAGKAPTVGTITFTNKCPLGAHIINFSVSDGQTTTTCGTEVTVVDRVPPTINCPPNISTTNSPGTCLALVNYTVTATDNIPGVRLACDPVSGSAFPKGTSTVHCIATDTSSNLAACTFTVTVRDAEAPKLHLPANIVTGADAGQCSAVVSFSATATDNCSGNVNVACTPASGSVFATGTTTVNCTATDSAGNASRGSFTVTVNDTESPKINCPADILKMNDSGKASAVVTFNVTATDNCSGASVLCQPASGSAFPLGTNSVACKATDASGNASTCSFHIVVGDKEPPKMICPSNMVVTNDPGLCSAVVNYKVTATDNMPGVIFACVPPSGSVLPTGITTVNCIATDSSSNTATCRFTVTVLDLQAPTVSCLPAKKLHHPDPAPDRDKDNQDKKDDLDPGVLQLFATDNCDSNPKIYIKDSVAGFMAGPFQNGDKVQITQAKDKTPSRKPKDNNGVAQIQLKGVAMIYAVDASGNTSPLHPCIFCSEHSQGDDKESPPRH